MMKHTPGPWTVSGPNGYCNQIGIGRRQGAKGPIDPIGCVYGDPNSEETKANAELFARAPEMHTLLRDALNQFSAQLSDEDARDWLVEFVGRAHDVLDSPSV